MLWRLCKQTSAPAALARNIFVITGQAALAPLQRAGGWIKKFLMISGFDTGTRRCVWFAPWLPVEPVVGCRGRVPAGVRSFFMTVMTVVDA